MVLAINRLLLRFCLLFAARTEACLFNTILLLVDPGLKGIGRIGPIGPIGHIKPIHLCLLDARARCRNINVTDRGSQCVACVERLWRAFQIQQHPHHFLDLMLFSSTVAD